jgi:hypothetical protein
MPLTRTRRKRTVRKSSRKLRKLFGGDFSDAQQYVYSRLMDDVGYTQAEKNELLGKLNFLFKYINDNAERHRIPADLIIHHLITRNDATQLRVLLNEYIDKVENEGSVAI